METELDTKTFNVLEHLRGKRYPEDTVTVYTDSVALMEYERVYVASNASGVKDPQEFDDRLEELRDQIKASALTFHLRGYAPALHREIMKQARGLFKVPEGKYIEDYTEAFRWVNLRAIAESIQKVVTATGEVDERLFTIEDVEAFEGLLDYSEFAKIQQTTFELSFRSLAFDAAVSADFS